MNETGLPLNGTASSIVSLCQSLQGVSSMLTAASLASVVLFSALSYFFYTRYSKSRNTLWLAAMLLSLLALLAAAIYLLGMAANTIIYGPPPQC